MDEISVLLKEIPGTSLEMQWLRGHRFEPWSGKIPTCRGAAKPVRHNY